MSFRTGVSALLAAFAGLAALPDGAGADQWTVDRLVPGGRVLATPDARSVVFTTDQQLSPADTDSTSDIYVRTGSTNTLVSVGTSSPSFPTAISEDGSTVAFYSSEQLTPNDNHLGTDIYKRRNGTTTLVTVGPNGENGPCIDSPVTSGACEDPFRALSADGRHVIFARGGHFVPGDEETAQCFDPDPESETGEGWYRDCVDIYDNLDGVTSLVSSGPTDPRSPVDHDLKLLTGIGVAPRNGDLYFESPSQLVPSDTDTTWDVYKWSGGVVSLATSSASGFASLGGFSTDGMHLIYGSAGQIWDHTSSGDTAVTPPGAQPYFFGNSPDTSHVYFLATAGLVPEDTDGRQDLYETGSAGFKLIGRGDDPGNLSFGRQFAGSTPNGSKSYFITNEPILPSDTDTSYDLYEFTSASGSRQLVSTGPTDNGGFNFDPGFIGVSDDGSRVAFETESSLVVGDNNTDADIYVRSGNDISVVTVTTVFGQGIGFSENANAGNRLLTRDGRTILFTTNRQAVPSDTDTAFDVYRADLYDAGAFARPKGATPMYISLVPAYMQCGTVNREHGPPLVSGACSPPVQASDELTVGTLDANANPAKSVGSAYIQVKPGNASTPADEADVLLDLRITDVRKQGDLSDYTGELAATPLVRITDKDNTPTPGGPVGATTTDFVFPYTVPCAGTVDATIGSTCSVQTTADSVVAGAIKEGMRANWQVTRFDLYDGGADADADTTGDNTLFATQGIFAP